MKIKGEIFLPSKRQRNLVTGPTKIEIITANDKSITVNSTSELLATINEENIIGSIQTEAKFSLSTNKEVTLTVLKKEINDVTVLKKVYVNDKEIPVDLN